MPADSEYARKIHLPVAVTHSRSRRKRLKSPVMDGHGRPPAARGSRGRPAQLNTLAAVTARALAIWSGC